MGYLTIDEAKKMAQSLRRLNDCDIASYDDQIRDKIRARATEAHLEAKFNTNRLDPERLLELLVEHYREKGFAAEIRERDYSLVPDKDAPPYPVSLRLSREVVRYVVVSGW